MSKLSNPEQLLEDLRDPQSEARKLFEERMKVWEEELKEQIESTRRNEILSAEDYAITINCRG